MAPTTSLSFKVTRKPPELITPAKPTPGEYKLLSDIDDQDGLRYQSPVVQLYRKESSSRSARDPVKVIREAISKTLVFYYPFAGRLREGPGRKLGVDCTGEGVVFIEADADVRIEEFGEILQSPFPCLEELVYDVPGSEGILNSPLLLIQVTRMKCGGFIFALRLNHTMSDAPGLVQFMNAVAEIARGHSSPSIPPVWQRELLTARDPPHETCTHHAYDEVSGTEGTIIPLDDLVHRSFFFSPAKIAALRNSFPPHLRSKSTTFEILTACLWRCRTVALKPDPEEELRLLFNVNVRDKFQPPLLPTGYYGNALAFPVATSTAMELCRKPLSYALELIKKAKATVTEEHMRSLADLMVIKGRPALKVMRSFTVSNVTRAGFGDVDFGWGKPVYGGPAIGGIGAIRSVSSYYVHFVDAKGERVIAVPLCLPAPAMERFEMELQRLLKSGQPKSSL